MTIAHLPGLRKMLKGQQEKGQCGFGGHALQNCQDVSIALSLGSPDISLPVWPQIGFVPPVVKQVMVILITIPNITHIFIPQVKMTIPQGQHGPDP